MHSMNRTAYINQPYFGESYFSIFNRYKDHLGLDGSSASRHLLGKVIRKFNPNQALNVKEFINRICPNSFLNNADAIIENHTLIPFLRPFISRKELKKIIRLMKETFINPFLSKKLSTTIKTLRYCPICVKSDRDKYGETYWHLMHSIPSWPMCPEHNCYLYELEQYQVSKTFIWYIADNLVKDNKPIVYGNEIERYINSELQNIFIGNSQFDRAAFLGKLKDEGFVENDRFTSGFRHEITKLLSNSSVHAMKEIRSFNKSATYKKLMKDWSPTIPVYLLALKYYHSQFPSKFKPISVKELHNEKDCRCGESRLNLLKKYKKVAGRKKDGLEIFCPSCGYRYNINTTNNKIIVLDYGHRIINQIKEARKAGKLYREISADLLINVEMIRKLSKLKNYKSYQEKFEKLLSIKRNEYLTTKKRTPKLKILENWLYKNDPEWLGENKLNFKRKIYTTIKVSDKAILKQLKKRFNQLCKENPNYRISKIKLLGEEFKKMNSVRYQQLLPKTHKFINGSIESWLSFKIRQISQFVESVLKSNGYLKEISERSLYHRFIGNRKSLIMSDVEKLKSFVRGYLESYSTTLLSKI